MLLLLLLLRHLDLQSLLSLLALLMANHLKMLLVSLTTSST